MRRLPLQYDAEGCLLLRGELFFRWKASDAELSRLDADIKLASHEVDALLREQPVLSKLLNDRAALIQQTVTSRHEQMSVLKMLEEHLGLSMSNVSIDDQTGRVHVHANGALIAVKKPGPAPKSPRLVSKSPKSVSKPVAKSSKPSSKNRK